MPVVEMTSHLYRFFPQLKDQKIVVPAGSVADVLQELDKLATGFSDYIMDERGALRRHVKISINNTILIDKKTLSDQVPDDATIFIFQSLTGG